MDYTVCDLLWLLYPSIIFPEFTHVVAHVSTSLLYQNNMAFYRYTGIRITHSSVGGHLGCFYLWKLWKMYEHPYINLYTDIFFPVLLSVYLGMELLSPTVILYSTFWETAKIFFKVVILFYCGAFSPFISMLHDSIF